MSTRLVRINKHFKPDWTGSVVAIGNFDGVHRGHVSLIKKLCESQSKQPGMVTVVQSFYPHPSQILTGVSFRPITALRKKLSLMSNLGVDVLAEVHFSKNLSQLTAEEYLTRYWINYLRAKHVVLGPDTALGKDRKGDLDFIRKFCSSHNIGLTVVDFVKENDSKLGSRDIRKLVSAGDFAAVELALARPFSVVGRVVDGDKRGRQLGFRTANIHVGKNLLPDNGVYATRSLVRNKWFGGVANIGVRPTFGGSKRVLEVHLFDYADGDFYGEGVEVEFVKRLRAENKFVSLEELKAQIGRDIIAAQECLINGR